MMRVRSDAPLRCLTWCGVMPAASTRASSASKEDALRQALQEFLEPNNILTCLNEAAAYWPIFVILV